MCAQSSPTLCDLRDCSPSGSSVHGILQARILEWVPISSSRGSSLTMDWTHASCISCTSKGFLNAEPSGKPYLLMLCCSGLSHLVLSPCVPMGCSPPGSSVHGDSPGKNTRVGFHALLQGIFPSQGSNPGLLHCRQILHHLSHQGSLWILEWVAYPFSRGSSWPRNQTGVFCIAGIH